jgi:hypothetical protein
VANPDFYNGSQDTTLTAAAGQGTVEGLLPPYKDFDPDNEKPNKVFDDELTAFLDGDGTTTQGGNVVLNPDGSFTYEPPADWRGVDTFTYYVSDGNSNSNPVSVTITVDARTPTSEEGAPPPGPLDLEDIGQIAVDDALWLATELCEGDEEREDESRCQEIQAYLAGAFLQSTDLRPLQAASRLRELATLLHDTDGSHIAALGQVINEFVNAAVPPSPEQFASISQALAGGGEGAHYATAKQWLDALTEYAAILIGDIGWSAEESVAFAMGKYGQTVTEAGAISVTAFIQMYLEGLTG